MSNVTVQKRGKMKRNDSKNKNNVIIFIYKN